MSAITSRRRLVSGRPHIIVLGNEKGGSGKSTTAMHIIVSLIQRGFKVASLDLDARQGTLSRYIENRAAYRAASGLPLGLPEHRRVRPSQAETLSEAHGEESESLAAALTEVGAVDFIVADAPGTDSYLSRLMHARADTLVTPLNDSFLDLDLLARIDAEGRKIIGPSLYAEMVWEQRKRRAISDGGSIDWIVMRNRLGHIDARNKRDIGRLLEQLARRIGFRQAPGFGERVIFRELFPKGLTLLDLREGGMGVAMNLSHVAARQEVRALIQAIGLEDEAVSVETVAAEAASGTPAPADMGTGEATVAAEESAPEAPAQLPLG
jgi:chromosome partitioning protein